MEKPSTARLEARFQFLQAALLQHHFLSSDSRFLQPDEQDPKATEATGGLEEHFSCTPGQQASNLPFQELDQFVLQALKNPRDRLMILKLDQEIEKFMNSSRTKFEFGPMSSYQRLIVHRVAQYFSLRHTSVEVGSGQRTIVLYKTAQSGIPILRFKDFLEHSIPPPQPQPVKIMLRRREKQQESSSAKNESETESTANGENSLLATRPLSLEEREEAYAKARARIFNETPTDDAETRTRKTPSPPRSADSAGPSGECRHMESVTNGPHEQGTGTQASKKKDNRASSLSSQKAKSGSSFSFGGGNGGLFIPDYSNYYQDATSVSPLSLTEVTPYSTSLFQQAPLYDQAHSGSHPFPLLPQALHPPVSHCSTVPTHCPIPQTRGRNSAIPVDSTSSLSSSMHRSLAHQTDDSSLDTLDSNAPAYTLHSFFHQQQQQVTNYTSRVQASTSVTLPSLITSRQQHPIAPVGFCALPSSLSSILPPPSLTIGTHLPTHDRHSPQLPFVDTTMMSDSLIPKGPFSEGVDHRSAELHSHLAPLTLDAQEHPLLSTNFPLLSHPLPPHFTNQQNPSPSSTTTLPMSSRSNASFRSAPSHSYPIPQHPFPTHYLPTAATPTLPAFPHAAAGMLSCNIAHQPKYKRPPPKFTRLYDPNSPAPATTTHSSHANSSHQGNTNNSTNHNKSTTHPKQQARLRALASNGGLDSPTATAAFGTGSSSSTSGSRPMVRMPHILEVYPIASWDATTSDDTSATASSQLAEQLAQLEATLRQKGASVRRLSNTSALAVFPNSEVAQKVLEEVQLPPSLGLRAWIVLATTIGASPSPHLATTVQPRLSAAALRMIVVDRALLRLEEEKRPIRVGMVGAGTMGRAIANQIVNNTKGMRLAAVLNRTLQNAVELCQEVGLPKERLIILDSHEAKEVNDHNTEILPEDNTDERVLLTNSVEVFFQVPKLDIVLEVTGTILFAADICLRAFQAKKDVVVMNAELDGTLGPILKTYADREGVIFSNSDGDQPGVEMNLYRYVKQLGLTPLVCGNIKGFHNIYRNPDTQAEFAARWKQSPNMVTSFCDGTKVSFEQAVVANATGMRVTKRGMNGKTYACHVDELTQCYDVEELRRFGGIVDYVVGTRPAPGIFVLASCDDPKQQHLLEYYKLGKGPLYSFYTPYHLCHFEVPISLARIAIFRDTVLAPLNGPVVDVVAAAKIELKPGDVLDSFGGFMTYGLCEDSKKTYQERLLPIGLVEGCTIIRPVAKDQVLTYDDIQLPKKRTIDKLRKEQNQLFFENK
ncbi:NAD(P)-dependent oxidoreductase [Balamuthia mandrillaris]